MRCQSAAFTTVQATRKTIVVATMNVGKRIAASSVRKSVSKNARRSIGNIVMKMIGIRLIHTTSSPILATNTKVRTGPGVRDG